MEALNVVHVREHAVYLLPLFGLACSVDVEQRFSAPVSTILSKLPEDQPEKSIFLREAVPDDDEHRRLEARDSLARLEAAIRRLKPKTREIFLSHHLEGLNYAEIAARYGMSVSGVEKQMGRAFDEIHRLTGLP